jgi:hypothetical protein
LNIFPVGVVTAGNQPQIPVLTDTPLQAIPADDANDDQQVVKAAEELMKESGESIVEEESEADLVVPEDEQVKTKEE